MESGLDGTATENFLLHLINALQDRSQMNLALQLLCRYQGPEVGPLIWYCRRARTALLNELDLMHISTGLLNMNASEARKVIRIIALLQRISSDPNLATQFLAQDVPYHLLPFITGISQNIYVESVCKASLVFFIRLLEIKREETITFLLGTNFINECAEVLRDGTLRVTETAVKIMLIFLQDQRGYAFICGNLNRLIATINGLASATVSICNAQFYGVLRNIISCYMHLAENERARRLLRYHFPSVMREADMRRCLTHDESLLISMELLLTQIYTEPVRGQNGNDSRSQNVTLPESQN